MSGKTKNRGWQDCIGAMERAQIELFFAFSDYSTGSVVGCEAIGQERFNQIFHLFQRAHFALDDAVAAIRTEHEKAKAS